MKLICIDMDGTIVNDDGALHQKDKAMLHRLQEQGHKIAFNTGRNYQEARFILEEHQFPYDYLVLSNGAHIMDREHKDLFKTVIPGDVGKEMIQHFMEQPGLWIFFYAGNRTIGYFNGKTYEHTAKGIIEISDVDFVEEYQKVESFNIMAIHQDNHEIDCLLVEQKWIQNNYGEEATGCINLHFMDITAATCSKGTGVLLLKEQIKEEIETYCIGDSYNDISMFKVADYAYTFHRVSEDISKYAHKQVDYVYEVVEDMLR